MSNIYIYICPIYIYTVSSMELYEYMYEHIYMYVVLYMHLLTLRYSHLH